MDQASKGQRKEMVEAVAEEVFSVLDSQLANNGDWYVEKLGDRELHVGDGPGLDGNTTDTFELSVDNYYSDDELGAIVDGPNAPPMGSRLPSGYRDVLRVRVEYVRRVPLD